jgi:hypothetical protein
MSEANQNTETRSFVRYLALTAGVVVVGLVGYLGFVVYPGLDLAAGVGVGLIALAAAAGIASFFSPCSFPLLVGMPLTPVAVFEGKVAASNMLKNTTVVPDFDEVPTAVFTIPQLARVGLLEDDARASGIELDSAPATPAAGTPTSGSARPPRRSRSSSIRRTTRSWVPTCSDPSTANSSTSAHSPSNSGSPPDNPNR